MRTESEKQTVETKKRRLKIESNISSRSRKWWKKTRNRENTHADKETAGRDHVECKKEEETKRRRPVEKDIGG